MLCLDMITFQGASTVCLPPEKGELGIVFKDIADFDKNGIDDLFVVMLSEYVSAD